jgi:hypothetical protein
MQYIVIKYIKNVCILKETKAQSNYTPIPFNYERFNLKYSKNANPFFTSSNFSEVLYISRVLDTLYWTDRANFKNLHTVRNCIEFLAVR